MNIEVVKKNSSNLNISTNRWGRKCLNIEKPQREVKQISLSIKPSIQTPNEKPNSIIICKKQPQQKTDEADQSLSEPKNQPESDTNIPEIKDNSNQATNLKTIDKNEQKDYINSVQNLINQISSENPLIISQRLQEKIDDLKEKLLTIITYDDVILNETKIIILFINLFLNQSIVKNDNCNDLYSIFFDTNYDFIIGTKLRYYFIRNDINSVTSIIHLTKKIFSINNQNKSKMITLLQNIKESITTLTKEMNDILINTIDEFKNDSNFSNRKKFLFDENIIFNTIDDKDLTNDYQKGWSSIQSYIKVMFNLSIENYFYPLRNHLIELRNNELDPRDLYLYEHVKIYPSYEYNEKSEHDLYIQFSIRAPNYKEGNILKQHKIREIDWEITERLSKRSLLFFSFSPLMDKIEAVALSCAIKGSIKNNVIPIQFLKGYLDIDKEYYMFEPIDHWNGPFFDNLLSTNEMTLPKSLIKPLISLDLSDNLMKNLNSIPIKLISLMNNQVGYKLPKFEFLSENEEVQFYSNVIISILEKPYTEKEPFLKATMGNLCKFLKDYERERGKYKKFDQNSEVINGVSFEIKRYTGFRIGNEKWPYDDFTEEEFREKCYVDHEQYKPIKYCLSHHLTLVNGAPGTGKTYLACELIKLLIKSEYNHPILIVTYKNVSLDNLLNSLAPFLERNHVDMIRLGGRPRTENKFILSKNVERRIPYDILKLKKQILYLTILGSKMNKCLSYLANKKINECSKLIIDDIDKSINIREFMFDKFPLYEINEEEIISNFFDPSSFIPSANEYMQFWIQGNDYYKKIKAQKHNEYNQNLNNLFSNIISFYYSKEGDEKPELINKIIKNHFSKNELLFRKFLFKYKNKISSKNITIIKDIINEYPIFDEKGNRSIRLKDYIKNENSNLLPKEKQQNIRDKFIKMLTNFDKVESFKQFINDLSIIIKEQVNESRELCEEKMNEFEKREVIQLGNELSSKKLIAMTATRASQYRLSLDRSGCQFMIIEEAGELTEPMAFSIIPRTIEHLVMIGDYHQLRPTVEHKLTFKPYKHHISLFEKEVIHSKSTKSDNLFTLSIQRRMHPQISSLIRKVFYNNNENDEKLNDDESTFQINKPFGFPNHIQFWLHGFEEELENKKMRSHVNIKEAQICAYLFLLMLCRGYKSSEITIISLYKGQKKQIEKELCKLIDKYYNDQNLISYDAFDFENDLPDYKPEKKQLDELIEIRKSLVNKYVVCLDDFQGEENEVIIISLTRSEKAGFVKNLNRALVTLSRAKQMEFVVGNNNVFGMNNQKNPLWQKISSEVKLIDDSCFHFNGIAACSCPIHGKKQKTIILNKPSDFIDFRFNCCIEKCNNENFCGHICNLPCHSHSLIEINDSNTFNVFKRRYYCEERCGRLCRKGHRCDEVCGNCDHFGCPPCPYNCNGTCSFKGCYNKCSLPCNHSGPCQCLCVSKCADCECDIKEFHDKLKFWNQSILVCTKCFYRRVELRRKGIPDDLNSFFNS